MRHAETQHFPYPSTSIVRSTDLQAAKGTPVLKTCLTAFGRAPANFITWLQLYHVEDELLHGRLYLGQIPKRIILASSV